MTFIVAALAAGLPIENGLDALEAQDRGYVSCSNNVSVTGSVNLDEAYRVNEGQSNRWDYGIGFRIGTKEFAVWIEPHSATSPREVDAILRKLKWLRDKLSTDQFAHLHKLTSRTSQESFQQFWWVAPGKIGFRKGTSEANRLTKAGINFPCKIVKLGQV